MYGKPLWKLACVLVQYRVPVVRIGLILVVLRDMGFELRYSYAPRGKGQMYNSWGPERRCFEVMPCTRG